MKNEYIKVFTKVSTLVLLILVVLFSLGFTSVMKIGQVMNERTISYYDNRNSEEAIEEYRRIIENV